MKLRGLEVSKAELQKDMTALQHKLLAVQQPTAAQPSLHHTADQVTKATVTSDFASGAVVNLNTDLCSDMAAASDQDSQVQEVKQVVDAELAATSTDDDDGKVVGTVQCRNRVVLRQVLLPGGIGVSVAAAVLAVVCGSGCRQKVVVDIAAKHKQGAAGTHKHAGGRESMRAGDTRSGSRGRMF